MAGEAGVLTWGPRPPGVSLGMFLQPIRLQQRSLRPDRPSPGGGAQLPPRPRPRIRIRCYGRTHCPAGPLFSPAHRPSPPLAAAASAAVRTWSSAPPRAAQGRSTQAQRWRGGLRAREATREGKAGELAHAQAGAWARQASPAGKMAVGAVRVRTTQ